jgi:hypothetical protein
MQLVQLTCLRINYVSMRFDVQQQFQHLSCLTALQQLAVSFEYLLGLRSIPSIDHLAQLTSLQLNADSFEFSASITNSWACRTVLQSLTFKKCAVQPEALAAFTQLRDLSLDKVETLGGASLEQLLLAVSQLPLLTEVSWGGFSRFTGAAQEVAYPSAAAFTALTASTNLCSLQLDADNIAKGHFLPVLFQPGLLYPCLRVIELLGYCPSAYFRAGKAVSEQQLQIMCSCCPAVESLVFAPAQAFPVRHPQLGSPFCSCQR